MHSHHPILLEEETVTGQLQLSVTIARLTAAQRRCSWTKAGCFLMLPSTQHLQLEIRYAITAGPQTARADACQLRSDFGLS